MSSMWVQELYRKNVVILVDSSNSLVFDALTRAVQPELVKKQQIVPIAKFPRNRYSHLGVGPRIVNQR